MVIGSKIISGAVVIPNFDGNSNKLHRFKQPLKTFLAALKEPFGSTIRAMRPTTLAQALQFITEEDNIRYLQKPMQPNVIKKLNNQHNQNYFLPNYSQNSNHSRPMTFQQPKPVITFQQPVNFSQFPRAPINIQRNPRPPVQEFPNNAQVFGKPPNVWNPQNNPSTQQPKPTPMSVVTRNTTTQFRRPNPNFTNNQSNNNYFQNNNQKPSFVSEELFNIEFDEQTLECTPEYVPEFYPDLTPDENTYPHENKQYENFQETSNLTDETSTDKNELP
ncbi:hypothetical protein NQ315_012874 [Exocentrus adspersus]|uniref:Uncharacterized protein n=1 Tax=Exocentrus adspersus TaxID=1586481 RepID=A0AAV8VHA2_9CUCU|nr:hypothetical protein NQ315_012874 [Exocentrus adspersus]